MKKQVQSNHIIRVQMDLYIQSKNKADQLPLLTLKKQHSFFPFHLIGCFLYPLSQQQLLCCIHQTLKTHPFFSTLVTLSHSTCLIIVRDGITQLYKECLEHGRVPLLFIYVVECQPNKIISLNLSCRALVGIMKHVAAVERTPSSDQHTSYEEQAPHQA